MRNSGTDLRLRYVSRDFFIDPTQMLCESIKAFAQLPDAFIQRVIDQGRHGLTVFGDHNRIATVTPGINRVVGRARPPPRRSGPAQGPSRVFSYGSME